MKVEKKRKQMPNHTVITLDKATTQIFIYNNDFITNITQDKLDRLHITIGYTQKNKINNY